MKLKELIIEGRYDSLVTKLSATLLRVIKDSYSAVSDPNGAFAGRKVYYKQNESVPTISGDDQEVYFKEIRNDEIPLEFYLSLNIHWIEGLGDIISDGGAYNDTSKTADQMPLVEVLFELDPAQYPNVLSEVSMKLKDILRHEIEHLTQSGWNMKSAKYHRADLAMRNRIATGQIPTARYYTLPKEIPAMIQGLYTRAKKSKQPFKDVVDANLQQGVDNGVITSAEKEQIKAVWRKYLPKLGITQEL